MKEERLLEAIVDKGGSLVDPYRNFIAVSRYSRWDEEKGRRETWTETVDRYVTFMYEHLEDKYDLKLDLDTLQEIKDAITDHKVMPSMRALMTAGPALERENLAGYNCSFIAVDSPRAFDEALYVLMNGTGLGFSVTQEDVNKLPIIDDEFHQSDTTIVVADSKLGWAKALKELIAMLYTGQVPFINTDKVRPQGARLKTFGGRASGPGPLRDVMDYFIRTFKKAAGRKLSTLECHDLMCKIAEIVVVGGVRRAALISLSDLGDHKLAKAKVGEWWNGQGQRALANNSAIYTEKPDVETFLTEWTNLIESKSGERGIFNLDSIRKHIDKTGRRDSSKVQGVNPCVSADTMVFTSDGPRRISDLEGKPFTAVVNGQKFEAPYGSFVTGEHDLYRLTTVEGYELKITSNHQILTASGDWVEAGDLLEGDQVVIHNHRDFSSWSGGGSEQEGYLMGLFVGDGNFSGSRGHLKVWDEAGVESVKSAALEAAEQLPHRSDWSGWNSASTRPYAQMSIGKLPNKFGLTCTADKHDIAQLEETSSDFHIGFIRGMFDSDGHVEGYANDKGFSVRLSQSNIELLKSVQRMLLRLGIKSTIALNHLAGNRSLPDGKGGYADFYCKDSYSLIVGADSAKRFVDIIGFANAEKMGKCIRHFDGRKRFYHKPFIATVKSFEFIGSETVWDTTVDQVHAFDANGLYVHNCGEIALRPNGLCNLTEVVVEPNDTIEDVKSKIRLATILGTYQSTLTNFKYLRKSWRENAEEERLLGVSLTGQFGNTFFNGSEGLDKLAVALDELRAYAIEVNKEWAAKLGINPSVAITTVKPSGTVSQLVKSSSGMHPWHSEYYLRSVRNSNNDPVTAFLKDAGIPNEPCVMRPQDTTVFFYPTAAPQGAITRKDLGAIEHLEIWRVYRNHWTEHNPSVTISVSEEEWVDVAAWVYKNWEDVAGISFLPTSDHVYKQAPYQDITQEEYEAWLERMPTEVHWSLLSHYEIEDNTESSQTLACVSDTGCDIVGSAKE
jgi:ribonucleotide reductase class II